MMNTGMRVQQGQNVVSGQQKVVIVGIQLDAWDVIRLAVQLFLVMLGLSFVAGILFAVYQALMQ